MTAAMGTVLLEARDLCLSYRNGPLTVTPIDHLNLTLEVGELVAVVGRSGSGKTTLLSIFGGWERPQEGDIDWQGRICDPGELRWDQVATVPQVPGLLEELTVRENIALPLLVGAGASWNEALYGERLNALLERLNLLELADRGPKETSLGEQQRCSIARALVCTPELVLADEPTAHQDAHMLSRVVDALAAAATEGACCVVATHSPEVIARASRVIDMGNSASSGN
jgi:putative ABC transport system ATP-binding protein